MRPGILVGLAVLVSACSPDGDTPAGDTLVTRGIVSSGAREQGIIWFELQGGDERFVVEAGRVRNPEAFYDALMASNRTSQFVQVRLDPDGDIHVRSGRPSYVVRELGYAGGKIAGMRGQRSFRPALPPGERGIATRALIRGVALATGSKYSEARTALSEALATPDALPKRLRGLAYKTRGSVTENTEYAERTTREESDRLLIAALADYKAWEALEPKNAEATFAVANTLRDLGAYEEAMATYLRIRESWKTEAYWSTLRIAATQRLLGNYERALATLTEYETQRGKQTGMAFNYHRGWTLLELGRFNDAAESFTVGLQDQPDYMWALVKRACAYSRAGQVAPALEDQRAAVNLWRGLWDDGKAHSDYERETDKRLGDVLAELETAVKTGRHDALTAPCDGYWRKNEKRRERSPLI